MILEGLIQHKLMCIVQPIANGMVGKVVVSAHAGFEVGDLVTGFYDVSEYSIVGGSMLIKLDPNLAQPSDYLGPLGIDYFLPNSDL